MKSSIRILELLHSPATWLANCYDFLRNQLFTGEWSRLSRRMSSRLVRQWLSSGFGSIGPQPEDCAFGDRRQGESDSSSIRRIVVRHTA
jgi:hypothetical protein